MESELVLAGNVPDVEAVAQILRCKVLNLPLK